MKSKKILQNCNQIKYQYIKMSTIRSYIQLRRQLTINSVDPALFEKILNFEIYIRGDSMAEYNDATLRYTLKNSLAVYIYDKEKVNEQNNELLLP